MRTCPTCGAEAPESARFCPSCGAGLAVAPQTRRVVTVIFCDWVGSTPLGEGLDAESLRYVQEAFYAEARRTIERHGGLVEKFIGDAVMAVFGVPRAHEDDALRAVRAALELRETLATLNERLERTRGIRFSVRTGINTGEVLAGDPAAGQSFVTGESVVVAKRLEAAAGADEILIGEATQLLVRDAALVELVEGLSLKGKTAPVAAWRLTGVVAEAPAFARRLDAPLVDREHELTLLRQALERSVHGSTGHLVTVLGSAGVGKSRLVNELLTGADESATALVGRCLPYGEGITFWPLVDIVRQAAAISPDLDATAARSRLAELVVEEPESDLIAERIAAAIGLAEATASTEETFLAVRRLLGVLGRRGPLVVALDDVQWAEPTFFDLIEYLADWIRDLPVLIVCLARPELLDERPTWAGGKLNATTILLDPLGDDDCSELVQNLLGQALAPDTVKREIATAGEGNPLFVEELIATLIEDSTLRVEDGRWVADDLSSVRTPPTIQALVAARLDRLTFEERRVIEVAAVIGKFFSRAAIAHLASSGDLERLLESLARKELIRHERDTFLGDDAFTFRHQLIRDGAYGGVPKAQRAKLHERHAAFLEDLPEDHGMAVDELVGYHLEQAFRYRAELGPVDDADRELAGRAGRHLAAAGHRALARNDVPAALNLLERASKLLEPGTRGRVEALLDLAAALWGAAGDLSRADAVLRDGIGEAEARGDAVLKARGEVARMSLRLNTDPAAIDDPTEMAERAIEVFEAHDDQLGLAKAWFQIAQSHWHRCEIARMEEVLERALEHAERADDQQELSSIVARLARGALVGPRPAGDAARRCTELRQRARGNLKSEATIDSVLGVLEAMHGSLEEARGLCRRSTATFEELGLNILGAGNRLYAGMVELITGDPAAAELELRRGYEALERVGERDWLSTLAALLARAVYAQGRNDEAEHFTAVSEAAASEKDIVSQVLWRGTRARVLASRGQLDVGERMARKAVALASRTDFLNMRADAVTDLADVLSQHGEPNEATQALEEALALYEAKGNLASATAVRRRLTAMIGAGPA